jgi:arylsulfatase A-like enzyme
MSDARPNILFILTDQQVWANHRRPGEFELRLPRFERFAREGAMFERAYTVCPLCTPARSSMMTGLYPSKHGLRWNSESPFPGNLTDFRADQRLYAHHLADAGYRNAYIGKWHCGGEKVAADYGMEGWSLPHYGKVYMSDAYTAYAEQRGLAPATARIEHCLDRPELEGGTHVLHNPSPWHFMNASGVLQGSPAAHEEQFTAHLAIEKLREIATCDQPWSLVASFWGPHQPYFPSEPYASLFDPSSIPEYPTFRDDLATRPLRHHVHRNFTHRGARRWSDWSTWQQVLARAYGQSVQTDAAIGALLDALDATGQSDNTLVVWCADHGDALASHGGLWDKASTFTEEVACVPMAIRWPRCVAAGQRFDQLVSNMDVTATMLDAAGVAVPADMDSRSLLCLCRHGDRAGWPDQLICEHHGHSEILPQRVLLHDRYKYVATFYDGNELYDLQADPYETNNLAGCASHAGAERELVARLLAHLDNHPDWFGERIAYKLRLTSPSSPLPGTGTSS